jgi:hypothetical protein
MCSSKTSIYLAANLPYRTFNCDEKCRALPDHDFAARLCALEQGLHHPLHDQAVAQRRFTRLAVQDAGDKVVGDPIPHFRTFGVSVQGGEIQNPVFASERYSSIY